MKLKIKLKIKDVAPIAFLILIASFICIKNYTPGTFLTGWDTLHPEFNFGLTIKRVIFGVFREDQGLGAVAAHSHMADLPHMLVLWLFHFFVPIDFLRYLYIFLNLIIGPLGVYFFLKRVVVKNKTASFLSALFYILNLGTMQTFVVPFEMFVAEYAMLPWLFLFASEYISDKSSNKKPLIFFSIATVLASPMAYAATLWYIYFLSLVLYLAAFAFRKELKKAAVLIILTLLLNSFWILPNIYFVKTQGENVTQAYVNKLFSKQAFLYNKEFGNIKDIALIKTFLFDWGIYSGGNHFTNVLSVWTKHLDKPYVYQIGLSLSLVALLGLFYSAYKKSRVSLGLAPLLLLSIFFLLNDNPPTAPLYSFFQSRLPLFREAFRFPDDKVLGLYIFVFAVYFGLGQKAILDIISQIPSTFRKVSLRLEAFVFCLLLFYFMLPAFQGYFISPYMRVKIPGEYFKMFSWFNKQKDNGRVAEFPIHSPWGWQYYNWHEQTPSFQGAGFIWFGIKQPLLNRDFDRWSPYNEQYFREMSYAVYSQNPELLRQVINKYNLHYLLLDKNIIAPENDPEVLFYRETESLLARLEQENFIRKSARFGKIEIFKVLGAKNYVYSVKNYTFISPKSNSYYQDFAYQKYGDYATLGNSGHDFLFRNLIDNQGRVMPNVISLTQEGAKLRIGQTGKNLSLPSFLGSENYVPASVSVEKTNNNLTVSLYPLLPQENNLSSRPITAVFALDKAETIISINKAFNFVLSIPDNTPLSIGTVLLNTKNGNTISAYSKSRSLKVIPDFSTLNFSLSSCDSKEANQVFGINRKKDGFSLFGKNTPICMMIPLEALFPNQSLARELLLSADFSYKGKPLSYMCLADIKSGACLDYLTRKISLGQGSNVPNYFGINGSDLTRLGIKVVFDTTQSLDIEHASYSNLSFSLSRPISVAGFSKDIIEKSIKNTTPSSKDSLVVPFSGNASLSQNITVLPKTSINCGKIPPVNHRIFKKILSYDKSDFIEYSSDGGVACDHFSYQNLSQDQAYLIAVASRNLKGLPLTLCVLNETSRHCDIYANLSKFSDFSSDIFLLPPMGTSGKGFDIDIASLGIKGSPSINDLKTINIIPFPYSFLSRIEANSQPDLPNNGSLLVFSRSFDKGWKLYQVQSSKFRVQSFLNRAFPFFFGKQVKQHVLVNNWENGWILDNSQLSTLNSQLVIIYLPQYLEYLGFFLTFLGLLFVFLGKRVKSKEHATRKFDYFLRKVYTRKTNN